MRTRLMMVGVLVLLHLFIGVTLVGDLPFGPLGRGFGWLYLGVSMVLLPLGLRSSAGKRWLVWPGLLAMGIFSSLAVLSLMRAFIVAVADLLGWGSQGLAQGSALVVLLAVGLFTLFGLHNARRTARVVERDIRLQGLPPALNGFRIVQLSDIHVGPTIRRGYLQAIVERANRLEPDLIAITGDLVDGSVEQLREHVAPLAGLEARHGSYIVTGNHEYYAGAGAWIMEFARLGLPVLLNEHVRLRHDDADLVVAGITDYSAHHFEPTHRSDPTAALIGAPAHAPKILLAHQPRSAAAAREAGFDLQLSGHTHGGQFWPWMHLVRWQQPWVAGLQRTGRLQVYISRGTGYWGPPLRFRAPSEITLIRLIAA